ncbi:MAG: phenylpyruvate tautomerase MIF-related protein [Fusobacteriota bacterium]
MPFIETKIGKAVTKTEEIDLKHGFAKIMEEEIGKPERALMINIEDEKRIYLGGKLDTVSYVEIKLLGKLNIEQKDILTNRIGKLYNEILNVDSNKIYITFFEMERQDWGFNGKTFASRT